MDLSKLTTSDRVLAGSGIALFIFSFTKWFDYRGYGGRSGWDYFLFGVIPVLLGLVLVAYVAITRFAESTKLPDLPVPYGLAVLIVAGLAALLILLKLIIGDSVGLGVLGGSVKLNRAYGIYLSFLASLGLVAGGYLKYQEEGGKAGSTGSSGTPPTPF